jgi:signal transduction histidine kinase
MRINGFDKIFKSVFTKLLLIIIVTGIAINIIVAGFFITHRSSAGSTIHKNIVHYLNYLIADLGDPPSLSRARQIASQTSLVIHFKGQGLSWSTSGSPPTVSRRRLYEYKEDPGIRFGRYHRHSIIEIDHQKGRFVFELVRFFDREDEKNGIMLALFALLAGVLALAYLLIRRVLRPVKWLNEGVKEVSRGNLKHRVPLKKSDELGQLAQAFNDMTDRVREMLQAKEQLMLDISHELRSPLTRMKVALEFLAEGKSKQNIKKDIEEMEQMINEILDTARRHHMHSKLNRRPVNLVDLLHEVVSAYKEQQTAIELIDLPSCVEIHVDFEQIKIVLKNIINNAIKYSGPESDPIRIFLDTREPYVILRVTDNGPGIPAEELSFIFEPFYRVDKSRSKRTGGFGLGLSLCKTIMEAHDGNIEIDSTPGKGTTVSLFFPTEVKKSQNF